MVSIILNQPDSLDPSIYPGQREGGRLTRFDEARLPVGAPDATAMAGQTIVEHERRSPAIRIAATPPRKTTHVTHADAPPQPGISPLSIGTMPRAEDDEATRAGSYEFHDRPGSGRHTADRLEHF